MRRAFTLVEVMVIFTVIAIVTAMAAPSIVAMQRGRDKDEHYNDILRLAQMGREAAIRSGHAYVMTVGDTGDTAVNLAPDDDQNAQNLTDKRTSNANPNPSPATTTTTPLPSGMVNLGNSGFTGSAANATPEDRAKASATLPDGASFGQLILGSKASSTSEFRLHFYPEGTSDGGGFEMIEGNTTRSLTVDRNGFASLKEGALPAAAEDNWEAGTYAQRT